MDRMLQQATLIIVDSDLVHLDSSQNPKPLSIPANRMARELGHAVVANIIMLGFLAAKSDIVSYKALKESVLDSIPAGTENFNTKAFELGYNYGVEHGREV
jgi:Pyruvate:ferredoxin oxidoreductase and related 2-oxoacid:ferredoxin oxidoreductases, gamma subunit